MQHIHTAGNDSAGVTVQRCYMRKQNMRKNEQAVSPVVGVMLMLVVTIIIAAVVSAFAGGLTAGKEKAPQVSLETHIKLTGGMAGAPAMIIKHLGGDPINTQNIKIVTSWANSTGIYHTQSTVGAKYNSSGSYVYYGKTGATSNYTLDSLNVHYAYSAGNDVWYNEPYLVVAGQMPSTGDAANDTPLWFGNYVMHPGDVIKADMNLNFDPNGWGGENQLTDKEIIADDNLLTQNNVVNVQLIDLKSGTTIYDKDVNVEV
jgi:archaeal type IV pilus assembly protein PilA